MTHAVQELSNYWNVLLGKFHDMGYIKFAIRYFELHVLRVIVTSWHSTTNPQLSIGMEGHKKCSKPSLCCFETCTMCVIKWLSESFHKSTTIDEARNNASGALSADFWHLPIRNLHDKSPCHHWEDLHNHSEWGRTNRREHWRAVICPCDPKIHERSWISNSCQAPIKFRQHEFCALSQTYRKDIIHQWRLDKSLMVSSISKLPRILKVGHPLINPNVIRKNFKSPTGIVKAAFFGRLWRLEFDKYCF